MAGSPRPSTSERLQRGETGRLGISLDEAQLDIDANGLAHSLDIAIKRHADQDFYAYNFENSSAPDLALPEHTILPPGPIHVRVTPANGSPLVGLFLLVNEGPGGWLSLAPYQEPPVARRLLPGGRRGPRRGQHRGQHATRNQDT